MSNKKTIEEIKECLDLILEEKISLTECSKRKNIERHSLKDRLIEYFPEETKELFNTNRVNVCKYTDQEIINFYNKMKKLNLSLTAFCKENKLNRNNFSKRCKKLNLKIINDCNKKKLNEKYFDILNENNSYWVGFLAADGYLSSDNHLELNLIDEEHVIKFKNSLNSEHKISKKIVKSNGSEGYRICITNKYMANRLRELGIVERKTYKTIIIPNEISNDKILSLNWLRGFFDGDGDISLKNNLKIRHVGFSSFDKESLEIVNSLIKKYLNLDFKILKSENRCYVSRIYKKDSIEKFLDSIYENGIHLERKYSKYKKYMPSKE